MTLDQCYQPWLEMQIQYDETIGCCCYYHGEKPAWKFETQPHLDIEEYWNGAYMQQLRKIIQNNDSRGTGCSGCQFVEYGIPELSETPPIHLTGRQRDNYRSAIQNFQHKALVLDSLPVRYYLNFGLDCNLRCVMCSQAEIRQIRKKTLPASIFDDLKAAFQYSEQVAVIGGEPLAIAEARAFIKRFNNSPSLSNVRLCLFTNGTLLHNYLDHYQNIHRINFCISLDGVGKTYEHIRKGASWKKTEQNIHQVLSRGKRLGHDWMVTIASVLMKSSLAGLIPYVQWCIANDVACHFVPVASNMLNREEDIFSFPQLLEEIPRWERIIDDAISILVRAGRVAGAADRLLAMKDKLSKSESLYRADPHLFAPPGLTDPGAMLNKIDGGKFMIWGTGSNYRLHFSAAFRSYGGDHFLGFVDNDSAKWGSVLDGKTVFSPKQMLEMQPETILIASSMRIEIIDQIKTLGLTGCAIY